MLISDVFGHERVKNVLVRAYKDCRIGHAYIFEGPEGVGRQTMAKAFANLLVCNHAEDGCVCGKCKDCSMADSGNHPDIRIITNQLYDDSKKSTDVLVDTIRNMKQEIYIKPYAAERKIYIIPRADTMNVHAQNSLLKVLEEPPEYCTIILIAENSNMFLPTILSRSVILRFERLPRNTVEEYMMKAFPNLTADAVMVKACMSGGSIGRAITFAEDESSDNLRNEVIENITLLLDNRTRVIYEVSLFLKRNKSEIDFIMNICRDFFRDLMYFKQTKNSETVVNSDKLNELIKLSDAISVDASVYLLDIIFKYSEYFSKNISYAIVVQCMAMELWEAIHDRGYRN